MHFFGGSILLMCFFQVARTRFGNLQEEVYDRSDEKLEYYPDRQDANGPRQPPSPTTTPRPSIDPVMPCDSQLASTCIEDCFHYIKEDCRSWSPGVICTSFSTNVRTRCAVLDDPNTLHVKPECMAAKSCIQGAVRTMAFAQNILHSEEAIHDCDSLVRTLVSASPFDARVDETLIKEQMNSKGCDLGQRSILHNRVVEEVGRVASAGWKECRVLYLSQRETMQECENNILERIANQTGRSGLGEKHKILGNGANSLARDSMRECINRTVGLAIMPRPDDLSACMAEALPDYFDSGGEETAELMVALQQVAREKGIESLEACLHGVGAIGDARYADYERTSMSANVLISFNGCVRDAQKEFERFGGVGRVEAAFRDRAASISSSAMGSCADKRTSASECRTEARLALVQNGVVPAFAPRAIRESAGEEAAAVRKACIRAGGLSVACDHEAHDQFEAFGGDATLYQTGMENARLQYVEKLSSACLRAAATAHQRSRVCRTEVARSYALMGGDVSKIEVVTRQAAGKAANVEMQTCFGEYHGEIGSASYEACALRAQSRFEDAGGWLTDFNEYSFEAAQRDTATTLEACLEDAGCKTAENGKPVCTNTVKETSCYTKSRDLLKRGIGQVDIQASDLVAVLMDERRSSISDEMNGCVRESLALTCTVSDDLEECLQESTRSCRPHALATYQACGGLAAEFRVDLRKAAQMAMRDMMKSCVLEELAGGPPWSPSLHSGSGLGNLSNSTTTTTSQKKSCEERSWRTLLRISGSVAFFEVDRIRAANIELQVSINACTLAKVLNATELTSLLKTSMCDLLDCTNEAILRIAAASLCIRDVRTDYSIAGGVIHDIEMQARQRVRSAIGDRNLACYRSPAKLIELGGVIITSDGHHKALCLQETVKQLGAMGISSDELALETRNAAAVDANDRMIACLEEAGYAGEVVVFEQQQGTNPNVTYLTPSSNRHVVQSCRHNVTQFVLQAGGQIGDMVGLFDAGARSALTSAIRQCVMSSQASPDIERHCYEVGTSAFILSGGRIDAFEDEMKIGARESMRDKIKACLMVAEKVMSYTKDVMLFGPDVEREDARNTIMTCAANATEELSIIVNATNTVDVTEMQRRMRAEAANASVIALSNLQQGEVLGILDEAFLDMLILGAEDDESAESEMSEYFGCVEKSLDLCSADRLYVKLDKKERCCSGVFLQDVDLERAEVPILGKGVPAFRGSGREADAMSHFEKYCLGKSDGMWDPMCDNTRQQVASSVRVGQLEKADAETTTMVTMSAELGDGASIATGMASSVFSGRQSYSAWFQVEDAKCKASCNVSGSGRAVFGRAGFGGYAAGNSSLPSTVYVDADVAVHDSHADENPSFPSTVYVDADIAVNELHLQSETTMEIMGRIIFARVPDVNGDINFNVKQGSGQIHIIGVESAIFDNAPDYVGDFAGVHINQAIPAYVKSQNTRPEWVARCSRRCRAYYDIADHVSICRNYGGNYHTDTTNKWAFQAGNVDCLKPLKRCIKVCLYGTKREIEQRIDEIAILDAGGLIVSPGVQLRVNALKMPDGNIGFISGAPDDEALDESGQGRGNEPSVKIVSFLHSSKVFIGCDLTAASNSTLIKRPCVELPSETDIRSLVVRVSNTNPEATIGRLCFRLVSTSRRLKIGLPFTYAFSPSFPIAIEDEFGNDVTSNFKSCCWPNGIGVAPHSASDADCPSCRTSTMTTTNTTTTTSTSTTNTSTSTTSTSTNTTVTTTTSTSTTSSTTTTTTSNTTTSTSTTTTSTTTTNTTTTTTGITTNTSTTSTTTSTTTTTTLPPQVEGTVVLLVDNVQLFLSNPKVKAALRVSFANLIGVLPKYVHVELRVRRRLVGMDRHLRGTVVVYYKIDFPPGTNAWKQAETMNKVSVEDINVAIKATLQRQGILQTVDVLSHSSDSVDAYAVTTSVVPTLGPAPSTTTRRAIRGNTNSAGGNLLIGIAFLCIVFSHGAYVL